MNPPSWVRFFANTDYIRLCQEHLAQATPALGWLARALALVSNEVRL